MITGRARYVDDITVPGTLCAAIVRSPEAHAKIVSIDTSAARRARDDVVAVFTGEDLAGDFAAPMAMVWSPPGRRDQDPRATGRWPAARSSTSAIPSRWWWARTATRSSTPPRRWSSSTNRSRPWSIPSRRSRRARRWCGSSSAPTRPTSGTSRAATSRRRWPRRTWSSSGGSSTTAPRAAAIEPRGVLADPHGDRTHSLQLDADPAHRPLSCSRCITGIPEDKLRIIAPDVGGGFGSKLQVYPEERWCWRWPSASASR